jgi:hypothetical protein
MEERAVVIGSSAEQKVPSLVLEYTIKKYAPEMRVVHTYDMTFPQPERKEMRSRTGFSFNRFAIPGIMGYQGVGAYLECDQIVFRDVNEIFSIPFNGATVLRTPNQASVLVLDCARLKWKVEEIVRGLDKGRFGYKDLMENLCIEPKEKISGAIPVEWNSLERYEKDKTALLHYTAMNIQPWRNPAPHGLRGLWMNELKGAIESGLITLDILKTEVSKRHIIKEVLKEASSWGSRSTV